MPIEKIDPGKIELGDRPENLMKHDAYRRVRGALRQIRWGQFTRKKKGKEMNKEYLKRGCIN